MFYVCDNINYGEMAEKILQLQQENFPGKDWSDVINSMKEHQAQLDEENTRQHKFLTNWRNKLQIGDLVIKGYDFYNNRETADIYEVTQIIPDAIEGLQIRCKKVYTGYCLCVEYEGVEIPDDETYVGPVSTYINIFVREAYPCEGTILQKYKDALEKEENSRKAEQKEEDDFHQANREDPIDNLDKQYLSDQDDVVNIAAQGEEDVKNLLRMIEYRELFCSEEASAYFSFIDKFVSDETWYHNRDFIFVLRKMFDGLWKEEDFLKQNEDNSQLCTLFKFVRPICLSIFAFLESDVNTKDFDVFDKNLGKMFKEIPAQKYFDVLTSCELFIEESLTSPDAKDDTTERRYIYKLFGILCAVGTVLLKTELEETMTDDSVKEEIFAKVNNIISM